MTSRTKRFGAAAVAGLALAAGGGARADTYTSSAAFEAAIAGQTQSVENYGTVPNGTTVDAGQTLDGLTYTAFTAGPRGQLQGGVIMNQYNNFSGESLGGRQSGGDNFFFGQDSVTVSFAAPVDAFGIFFNVNLNSGNYGFTSTAGSAFTDSTSYDTPTFVFAGLTSSTPFSSVTFTSSDATLGVYNVPEIITASAVPEPGTLALSGVLASSAVLARLRRRKAV